MARNYVRKTEDLKSNYVPETLFVGLGGIGSDIITRVALKCDAKEKENLRFVAMDTDANELSGVKNEKANIIPVQTSSTQSVLDYLNSDKSAMEDWFPVNTTLYDKTVSEGAGQVRAISRLALNATIKSGNINALYNAIDDLFLKDGGDMKQALRVIIVSSIAGGTGSGISMIVGMLIREYLHEHYREKACIIRGYLVMPGVCDTFGPSESERASLRRNGYATIKEINAFMMKASGFCGVRKDLERFQDLKIDVPTSTGEVKQLEGLPFDFCFLLDQLDKSQASMSTMEQYKEFAAQSLFEQNIGPMRTGSNSMEDNVIKEFANGDNLGRNRFGGIGASVVKYPYDKIVDYVAFSQAIERIGCDDTDPTGASGLNGWLKYDRAFKDAQNEYKKKRAFTTDEAPVLAQKYVEAVNNGESRFDQDVKSYLAREFSDQATFQSGVDEKVDNFLKDFKQNIIDTFMEKPSIADNIECYENLNAFNWRSYKGNQALTVSGDKASLDELKAEIDNHAKIIARDRARAILFNAPMTKADAKDYHLETLVKIGKGAMHPNSARYILYTLLNRLNNKELDEIRDNIAYYREEQKGMEETLLQYGSEYAPPEGRDSQYDISGKFSKGHEVTLDDLCETIDKCINQYKDKQDEKDDFIAVMGAGKRYLKQYYSDMMHYRDCILLETAYIELRDYVSNLCLQFENFYKSFEEKAFALKRRKREIVENLKFRKGDSVLNICGTEEQLQHIYKLCSANNTDLLLPDELNAEIFDAVKKNAEVDRTKTFDPRNAGEKEDIFDEVLIDYFRKSTEDDYEEIIDINIIQAIRLQQSIENEHENGLDKKLSDADKFDYLKSTIKRGAALASPGIGFGSFDADRMMALCAYNKALNKMLDVNVKSTIEKCEINNRKIRTAASESVSKYDLRFFNALYNITPDKLSRMKNPKDCEGSLSSEEQGIYYTAYHEYSKKIGPDSTKSGTISSHIDKRWDAIVEMPEISMNSQYAEMIRIHSSLIYGIVHGMIIVETSSQTYDRDKKVFSIEDDEGDVKSLVVSNGSECDEFYEVLDALYRDNATVEAIFQMAKERRKYDEEASRNYSESKFVKDCESFYIGKCHKGKTSLFEIPLVYYNSLPKAKLDGNELSTMVDAVIEVMENEINRFEKEKDRKPLLAIRLQEQFKLLIENFQNDKYDKEFGLRKNTELSENSVVRVVLRKISRKIKDLDVSNFNEKIDALKAMVKEQ